MMDQTAREKCLMEAADWLLRLREADVTPETIAEWRMWCRSSPHNDQAFSEVQSVWDAAGSVPRRAVDASDISNDAYTGEMSVAQWRATSTARQRMSEPWMRRALLKNVSWLIAAAAGLVAFFFNWTDVMYSGGVQTTEIVTGIGMQREVHLTDGSTVSLAGGSRLRVHLTAAERQITLAAGEAYFRVAKDKHRPFVVQALDAKVTAVGTAFNVRAENHMVRVAVTEGVVEVARPTVIANHASDEKVHLTAGRELTWQAGRAAPVVAVVDRIRATSWLSGTLEFSDESLSTVVAAINRYSQHPLRIAEPALGEYRFTGTVEVTRIDEWLAGLQNIFPVAVNRVGSEDIIVSMGAPTLVQSAAIEK
jgi:transmembrane sensor